MAALGASWQPCSILTAKDVVFPPTQLVPHLSSRRARQPGRHQPVRESTVGCDYPVSVWEPGGDALQSRRRRRTPEPRSRCWLRAVSRPSPRPSMTPGVGQGCYVDIVDTIKATHGSPSRSPGTGTTASKD